jgi:hypothetical protein
LLVPRAPAVKGALVVLAVAVAVPPGLAIPTLTLHLRKLPAAALQSQSPEPIA